MSSSWFIVSNSSDMSINKASVKPGLNKLDPHFSINNDKTYFVLNPVLYPHKNGERNFSTWRVISFCVIR